MFKKRTIKNIHKKQNDIKDNIKEYNNENKNIKENKIKNIKENEIENIDENILNDNLNNNNLINEDIFKSNIINTFNKKQKKNDVDVVCKFLLKKKIKNINKEKSLSYKKYKKLINDSTIKDKNEKLELIQNDKIYKGEQVDSNNYRLYEIDTCKENDQRSILERNIKISENIKKGILKENVYRGKDAFEKAINISKDSISRNKYTGLYGQVRSSGTNVRMTLRVDYEPCICKDYKETGYCGFGDTCIFLHDRSDYKSGWKIEAEYEAKRKKEDEIRKKQLEKSYKKMLKRMKKKEKKLNKINENKDNKDNINNNNDDNTSSESSECSHSDSSDSSDHSNKTNNTNSSNDTSLPFACLNCKVKWKIEMNPSVTECSHYFCEKCFIDMFKNDNKCVVCGLKLSGIMNRANNIIDILENKNM